MAKLRINSILKLKVVAEKLHKSRFLMSKKHEFSHCDKVEDLKDSVNVPDDVKKGHFAVIAVDDDELKRFVVPICVLTQSWFVRLLEQAAEEYGFASSGALTVPCRPSELEKVLQENLGIGARENKTLVNSC